MNLSNNGRSFRTVLVLCLAGLFFLLAAGVAILSSGIYRSVVSTGDANATQRTALSYIANQVRRGDAEGVAVVDFDRVPALQLRETGYDGTVYVTMIYCYDGQLRELYTEENSEFSPDDGLAILPLESLELAVSGPLLSVTARDSGTEWTMTLSPRTGLEEVALP